MARHVATAPAAIRLGVGAGLLATGSKTTEKLAPVPLVADGERAANLVGEVGHQAQPQRALLAQLHIRRLVPPRYR